jgi:hypothetical protein
MSSVIQYPFKSDNARMLRALPDTVNVSGFACLANMQNLAGLIPTGC